MKHDRCYAVTRRQTEAPVFNYPTVPGLNPPALAKDRNFMGAVWQRVESYIAYRFVPRAVTWLIDGPGDFVPPLTPVTITKIERWDDTGDTPTYEEITAPATADGGYRLCRCQLYRFTGTAGADDPIPLAIQQAVARLANYVACPPGKPGASVESYTLGGDLMQRIERNPAHMAMALQNSGAADLLRPFRRI